MNSLQLIDQRCHAETSTVARPRDLIGWRKTISRGGGADRERARFVCITCPPKLWVLPVGVPNVFNSPQEEGSDPYLSFGEIEIDG